MSRNYKITTGIVITGVVLVGAFIVSNKSKIFNKDVQVPPDTTATTTENNLQNNLPGLQTSEAPWIAEIEYLKDRLAIINLPTLKEGGEAVHTHQHLDIFIHGKKIAVPSGIGINEEARFISPIHTHDEADVIHVESPTVQDFSLGQFFDIWGVAFDNGKIGGYQDDASSTLNVYVNGKKVEENPRDIKLLAHEEIVITFGTKGEESKIPISFVFPEEE